MSLIMYITIGIIYSFYFVDYEEPNKLKLITNPEFIKDIFCWPIDLLTRILIGTWMNKELFFKYVKDIFRRK